MWYNEKEREIDMTITESEIIIYDEDTRYNLDIAERQLTIEMQCSVMEDVIIFTIDLPDTPEFLALIKTVEQIIDKKTENILNHVNELIKKQFQKESQ